MGDQLAPATCVIENWRRTDQSIWLFSIAERRVNLSLIHSH
jgi:hypothetical protein